MTSCPPSAMYHCSESSTIRASYTGTFGTYCGCLHTQQPLEYPATQRSLTVKSAQTATEIRETHLSRQAKNMN
jgi:hypothetical protein